jgi:SAM-dependent methyltransferase
MYRRLMEASYDPATVARIFDEYGEQEWERHEVAGFAKVAFHLHRKYLAETIRPGDRVLEVGAGPGRFTIELARLGASVVVGDVSPGQLELNRHHVEEAGLESYVEARLELDILDLSRFADGSFDAVVCFGGPLSYVLDGVGRALDELIRVTRSRGHMLLSVMSNHGSLRAYFGVLWDDVNRHGLPELEKVLETGDLPQELTSTAPNHMFTSGELLALLEERPCDVLATSAANFLTLGNQEDVEVWMGDPQRWERLLEWEARVCAGRGALDGGTHIIAVARVR